MAEKTVSFINPVDPVGSQVALQQLQRRQRLADALREQSLRDIPSNGGTISWTQGLAKIANALVAKSMQKDLDKRTLEIGMQGANATRGMFGLPAMGGGIVEQGPTPRTMGEAMTKIGMDPSTVSPEARSYAPISQGGGGNYGAPTPPQAPTPIQSVDVPPSGAPMQAEAPQQPEQTPQPTQQGYPMSLTGNREQDYAYYVQDKDEYMKAVLASHQPTDFVRMLQQGGIDPNSAIGKQLIQSNIAKQNYTAPISGRGGSTLRDPYNPQKVIGYDAPTIEGAIPQYGEDGSFTGYKQAPGATEAIAATTAAKAGANAGFKPIQVFNPRTGQMEYSNEANVSQGGGGGGGGAQRGPGGSGPIDGSVGGAFAAAPPPGFASAATDYGKGSAAAFTGIQNAGADVPNRMLALREMGSLLDKGLTTGPTQGRARELAQKLGIPGIVTDNSAEFNKWAAQYSARSAQELGLSGTDKQVGLTVDATPSGKMPNGAARKVVSQLYGIEASKAAMANAATTWARSRPDDHAGFQSWWRQNYDPTLFEHLQWSPAKFKDWFTTLPTEQRASTLQKYRALKAGGAIQ